jgi:hypothetical protein
LIDNNRSFGKFFGIDGFHDFAIPDLGFEPSYLEIYLGRFKKTGKNRKNWKRREKRSQNIKACRIENTLKLVTSP